MSTIQPEGEHFREAVKWIGSQRMEHPKTSLTQLIDQAGLKFNLTPIEADCLSRMLSSPPQETD